MRWCVQRSALIKGGIWSHVATLEHHYYHMDEVWHGAHTRTHFMRSYQSCDWLYVAQTLL